MEPRENAPEVKYHVHELEEEYDFLHQQREEMRAELHALWDRYEVASETGEGGPTWVLQRDIDELVDDIRMISFEMQDILRRLRM